MTDYLPGLERIPRSSPRSSVDPADVARFSALADQWWAPDGPFRPLHELNPTRLDFLRQTIGGHFERDADSVRPCEGLTVLDIGCGGGLVAEPMARLGATVTAVDASPENIAAAAAHAASQGLDIAYRSGTAEALTAEGLTFDVVLALEVIEHTADPGGFLASCRALTRPDGLLILSTLNRTARSYIFGIIGAEYIARWVPPGTHDWRKFMKPSELSRSLRAAGFQLSNLMGMIYHPLTQSWSLAEDDLNINYFAVAVPADR